MSGVVRTDMVSVTVHGPAGSLDLVVPGSAVVADVVREYAATARVHPTLVLLDRTGRALSSAVTVEAAGIRPGAVLVATSAAAPAPQPVRRSVGERPASASSHAAWGLAVGAGVLAVLGAVVATAGPDGDGRTATAVLLGVAALAGVLPFGVGARQRAAVSPIFAGGAAFVAVHEPGATQLPVTVGISALVAAAVAGIARAGGVGGREALDVWTVAGLTWFALVAVVGGAGAEPQVLWSLVLAGALLLSRAMPRLAVDVPDRMLVDVDRLAVGAWSARAPRPPEVAVPVGRVEALLARGGRVVDAGAVAIGVSVVVAAPQVVLTATSGVDRIGAAVLLLAVGAGLLLASRGVRHRIARAALRGAGTLTLLWGCLPHLGSLPGWALPWTLLALLLVAAALVGIAVAVGRGWRSVAWSRRADVAEIVTGAVALAALVVASGWFRAVWEFRA